MKDTGRESLDKLLKLCESGGNWTASNALVLLEVVEKLFMQHDKLSAEAKALKSELYELQQLSVVAARTTLIYIQQRDHLTEELKVANATIKDLAAQIEAAARDESDFYWEGFDETNS